METDGIEGAVEGWLLQSEGRLLAELSASWPGVGRVVELGSFKGRSTICLAEGIRRGGHQPMIAVDDFRGVAETGHAVDTESELRANLASRGLLDSVEIRRQETGAAGRAFHGTVRVLFVDAGHEEEEVRRDVDAWWPHVESGGVVVFHDMDRPGPAAVARRLVDLGVARKVCEADRSVAIGKL